MRQGEDYTKARLAHDKTTTDSIPSQGCYPLRETFALGTLNALKPRIGVFPRIQCFELLKEIRFFLKIGFLGMSKRVWMN
ncbi:MAG: hypothetical protein DRR19_07130 [Candidatus Parabeggiatoa sp. nov. 1]|nr:MAG: hypothetical protein DRR19_07130 [Gammaproteobacteria bacterium]